MADRGLTAAVAELERQHAEADAEDAQLGLFAPPASDGGKKKAQLTGWNGVGRKPGARNKRTTEMLAFLQARYRDPRAILAEMAEANVYDLAALLQCSLFDAYQEKRLAAIGLLPYWAARITPEVVKQFNGIFLNIVEGRGEAGDGIGIAAAVLDRVEYTTVEDQGVSDDQPDQL